MMLLLLTTTVMMFIANDSKVINSDLTGLDTLC